MEAEIFLIDDMTTIEAIRQLEINEQTYYRRQNKYKELVTSWARKMKELYKEYIKS